MSKRRILVFAGSLFAVAGAAGLSIFGSAPVGAMGIMMVRITAQGTDPLPHALGQFLPAALCSLLLVVGLVATCAGLVLTSRQDSITIVGRILTLISGVGILAAAILIGMGLLSALDCYRSIATSNIPHEPIYLQEAIDSDGPLLTTGFRVLSAAVALPLLAALVGFRNRPARRSPRAALLVTPIVAAVGLAYVTLFFLSWQQSTALESCYADSSVMPKPATIASHLVATLKLSLVGCPLLILLGGLLATAGLLAPGPSGATDPDNNGQQRAG